MQAQMLAQATGPEDAALYPYVIPPTSTLRKASYRTQRMRSMQGSFNFDMSGSIILTVAGAILIFIGILFEPLLAVVVEHSSRSRVLWKRFVSDGLYQF